MRLLDYVCLLENEALAPPTTSTFECSITKLASYEHSDSWNKLCNNSWVQLSLSVPELPVSLCSE